MDMVVTIEMIVAVTGFLGTLIAIYINSHKFKSDTRKKLTEEIEWRTKTTLMLETMIRNSEEARLNQSKIEDMGRKHEIEISQINRDVKLIFSLIEEIKLQIPKRSGDTERKEYK